MRTLDEYVDEQVAAGICAPADVADRIMAELADKPRGFLLGFIRSLLPQAVTTRYSRRRMGLPERVRHAALTGRTRVVRDAYAAVIPVGGVWKPIGDCTRGELFGYAAMLRRHAEATVAKAEWYERLAAQLPDDVTTVRQARLDLTV